MGVGEVSVAAASATVGSDLFNGEWFQQVGYNRAITGIGIAGSAAALDTLVALFVDTVKIGEFYNTATGAVLNDAHLNSLEGNLVPAGTQIHCEVVDAPATNPIQVKLTWAEV
jgi:hypothetical protein